MAPADATPANRLGEARGGWGALWNGGAIAYTLGSYGAGLGLLLAAGLWQNALGLLLLTHSLVCSAYLSHEFMHGTVFRRRWGPSARQLNALGGTLMLWINGGCYARFADLARLHLAHHVDRVDYASDFPQWLRRLPKPLFWGVMALEWLYIPAVDYLLHWRSALAPFIGSHRREERSRAAGVLLVRGLLFGLLGLLSWKALLLYGVAYSAMLQILRLMDAFQHTYPVFELGAVVPRYTAADEQRNTFSNVISLRWPWLNLLLLNFGYHNAHHHAMTCPWYCLPALDRQLFRGDEPHYVPLPRLLDNFHRFRLSRIFSDQGQALDAAGQQQLETFYGAIGVSFLVLP